MKTLAPKEVKYDYVSIREAFGFIGDGLPVIDVDYVREEMLEEKGLVDGGISEVLKETLNISKEDVDIVYLEKHQHIIIILAENLSEWVPSDE